MPTPLQDDASDGGKQDHKGAEALMEKPFRVNPEVLKGLDLPGLEEIEVVMVVVGERETPWARWSEGLSIHLVASSVVGVLAFLAGRWLPF